MSRTSYFTWNRWLGTSPGDANLDGVFNSADLVAVFIAGQYEDGRDGNSHWEEGDWNCDGEFDSRDLVAAFQAGGYTAAARISTQAAGSQLVDADQSAGFDTPSVSATQNAVPSEAADSHRIRSMELAIAKAKDERRVAVSPSVLIDQVIEDVDELLSAIA